MPLRFIDLFCGIGGFHVAATKAAPDGATCVYASDIDPDAQEAYRLGAVERVVARDQLIPTAREMAETIAAKSPAMVKLAKEALTGVEDGNLEDKYRWEQGFTFEAYTMGDSQEARDAFVEKRKADFE